MSQQEIVPLGINGLGRIGKLLVWHHVGREHFPELVVNLGREVGTGLEAVCHVIENDSTYGAMHRFLYGVDAAPCVRIIDRERRLLAVSNTRVTVLQEARNPRDIDWRGHGIRLVVDTTGAFDDPTRPEDDRSGSIRGHLQAGADAVIYSAAFKTADKRRSMPEDAPTLIYGINHEAFEPYEHRLISAASCTTTALAHMLRPLLDRLGTSKVMTASMSTVHAATNSQSVLDTVPGSGARDLRRNRSVLNNIILTSTNAAEALERVMPEVTAVGFMADSVRIPIPTESLIILNITFQSRIGKDGKSEITREVLNSTYRDAAQGLDGKPTLVFSEDQNVPADVAGRRAAVVIEGTQTHTRTGFVELDLAAIPRLAETTDDSVVQVPVTHAKIFGWYDNEYGSYTNLLGDLSVYISERLR